MLIEKIGVGAYLKEAYSLFGRHVNTQRAAPQLMDGCKPVTRRTLYSSYLLGNKMTKSATIMGKTIGEFHPHGSASVYPVIVGLVKSGIMEGQGQWGKSGIVAEGTTRAAAERYTEAKLSESFYEFFDMLMKYVPFLDSEIDGYKMPEYLPTPVPISLITGTFGIGFGMNTNLPAFTVKSLMDAYLHDDPKRLRLPYDLMVDYNLSDFDKLWTEGRGNIICSFKVEQGYSLDGTTWGTIISGDPSLFRPTLTEELMKYYESGKIIKRDETSRLGSRLFTAHKSNHQ